MRKNVLGAIAIFSCALAFAIGAHADAIPFEYSGQRVAVSGVLFGSSNGNGIWTITGIAGTYNGTAIDGIVPLGTDSNYIYDNLLFDPAAPAYVDYGGILFHVPGLGDVNLYFDPGVGYLDATGDVSRGFVTTAVAVNFGCTTPEPGRLGLLGTGILGIAAVLRRELPRRSSQWK